MRRSITLIFQVCEKSTAKMRQLWGIVVFLEKMIGNDWGLSHATSGGRWTQACAAPVALWF